MWSIEWLSLNLEDVYRKKLMLAIIKDRVCVRMSLSVWAADQAADIRDGFSQDLRLVKLVSVNYCFVNT